MAVDLHALDQAGGAVVADAKLALKGGGRCLLALGDDLDGLSEQLRFRVVLADRLAFEHIAAVLGLLEVHLRDERQGLVRWRVDEARDALPFGHEVGVDPQHIERGGGGPAVTSVGDVDVDQRVRASGRQVLHGDRLCRIEPHVDDRSFGRRDHDIVDPLLALVPTRVAADELHPRARDRNLEHPRVGRVHEVEAHDLAAFHLEALLGLAADEQHVAEPTHGGVRRPMGIERRDPAVLDQDVVERQDDVAVRGEVRRMATVGGPARNQGATVSR